MTTADTADHTEVQVLRVFDATREQVFRAWTDPAEVAAWYGPAQMTVPADRVRIDARPGGRWELTMVPAAGGDGFSVGYEIIELVEPELLVMRSDPMPALGMPQGTVVRVELHDDGGRTRMVLTDGPLPAAGRDRAQRGYLAALDKLAGHLGG